MPEVERRRKRPLPVEMLLWDGTNSGQVDEFTVDRARFGDRGDQLEVWNDQERAWMPVPVGHHVVRSTLGELYPMSPEAREKTTEPEDATVSGLAVDEPLTHFFHCWRFPDHHRCAVALIERQSEENDQLLRQSAAAERAAREAGRT